MNNPYLLEVNNLKQKIWSQIEDSIKSKDMDGLDKYHDLLKDVDYLLEKINECENLYQTIKSKLYGDFETTYQITPTEGSKRENYFLLTPLIKDNLIDKELPVTISYNNTEYTDIVKNGRWRNRVLPKQVFADFDNDINAKLEFVKLSKNVFKIKII